MSAISWQGPIKKEESDLLKLTKEGRKILSYKENYDIPLRIWALMLAELIIMIGISVGAFYLHASHHTPFIAILALPGILGIFLLYYTTQRAIKYFFVVKQIKTKGTALQDWHEAHVMQLQEYRLKQLEQSKILIKKAQLE